MSSIKKNGQEYLFLNNQPDALIVQIYSVIKFYIFGNIQTLLGSGHQKPA
jgi:hypothetical protein